jgi:hypothetical protein
VRARLLAAATAAATVLTLAVGVSPTSADGGSTPSPSPTPSSGSTSPTPSSGSTTTPGPLHMVIRDTWKPPTGPAFNNPYGPFGKRYKLEHRIVEAIKHTPDNGRIRIAIYSFDRVPVARALVAAHRRGVQVQILLNNHQVTAAQRILHRALGTDPTKKNFTYECKFSCRGHANNLHTKFYLFDRAGAAHKVIMVGSQNLTLNAVKWQWNDLYTRYGNNRQFREYVGLFNSMRHDYDVNQPYYVFCGKPASHVCNENKDFMVTRVYPKFTHVGNDDIMEAFNKVRCVYKSASGKTKHTRIWIAMHTWRGKRGNWLAVKVRSLWAAGCDVKVDYGLIGFGTKQILGAETARGRIPLRSMGFDYNDDGEVDRYTHQKNFTILGDWGGNTKAAVSFTGSSNFATLGTAQDEIVVSLLSRKFVRDYNTNFMLQWNNPRYSRNAYTTTYSTYRTVSPDQVGGMARTQVVRVKHVLNLPDHLHAGGSHWEGD